MKPLTLPSIYQLQITVEPSALICWAALLAALFGVGLGVLHMDALTALLAAAVCTALYIEGELWHQLGHAFAARRTGYPMTGITFFLVLGRSIYPADEPTLPPSVHIQRALGGPIASALASLLWGVLLLLLPVGSAAWWVIAFAAVVNVGVFTLGAFMPLGFTDGSTLLRYWGK
jgi:hypothetical protein